MFCWKSFIVLEHLMVLLATTLFDFDRDIMCEKRNRPGVLCLGRKFTVKKSVSDPNDFQSSFRRSTEVSVKGVTKNSMRQNKMSWFSYNQSRDYGEEELTLHPLQLHDHPQDGDESPVTESFWLSPNREDPFSEDEFNGPDTSATSRKTVGRKTGFMGKGKSHHRGRPEDSSNDHSSSNNLNMDPDSTHRTHLLNPGRGGDETSLDGRPSGSPSLLQAVFGGSWARRSGPSGPSLDVRNPTSDPTRYRNTPDMESYYRGGPSGKQVSFVGEEQFSEAELQPERKANSYNCDPLPHAADRLSASNNLTRQMQVSDHETNGKGSSASDRKQQPPPSRRVAGGQPRPMSFQDGSFPPESGPPPSRTRRPVQSQMLSLGSPEDRSSMPPSTNVSKDCFVIPQENLERFLPDGITLPREPRRHPLINILEVDDPKLGIVFHLMGPLTSLTPHLDSPLNTPLVLQQKLAGDEVVRAKELQATEGFLLKNLEKDSEYPFINYFVIHKSNQETRNLFRDLRTQTFDAFCPTKTGYACQHSVDLYDEVATIARPPVEPLSKKPLTDLTGYIICLYRVFKGDDGEKFERNWLYWTGARMLYKNLPRAVGLRRITLHKSVSNEQEVVYLLLVECTHFMDHIGEAANLLPILRGRICGYTGIFRVAESF